MQSRQLITLHIIVSVGRFYTGVFLQGLKVILMKSRDLDEQTDVLRSIIAAIERFQFNFYNAYRCFLSG